jgi:hypothetical protein
VGSGIIPSALSAFSKCLSAARTPNSEHWQRLEQLQTGKCEKINLFTIFSLICSSGIFSFFNQYAK